MLQLSTVSWRIQSGTNDKTNQNCFNRRVEGNTRRVPENIPILDPRQRDAYVWYPSRCELMTFQETKPFHIAARLYLILSRLF